MENIVVTDVNNDVRIPAKVLIHVWSYDFYDMTLSTGKQRRHMLSANTTYIHKFYASHHLTTGM